MTRCTACGVLAAAAQSKVEMRALDHLTPTLSWKEREGERPVRFPIPSSGGRGRKKDSSGFLSPLLPGEGEGEVMR